jgi:excinuclease ABC subunit C
MNVGKRVLDRYQLKIPLVAVVKDERHKAKAIIGDESIINTHKKSILLANAEAHRFAIAFHKNKRSKNFLK